MRTLSCLLSVRKEISLRTMQKWKKKIESRTVCCAYTFPHRIGRTRVRYEFILGVFLIEISNVGLQVSHKL
jgi:hypothetical protein